MPSIYDLKPRFQQLLRPATALLHWAGCTANSVTVVAALASAAYGLWLALAPANRWAWALLPAFLRRPAPGSFSWPLAGLVPV